MNEKMNELIEQVKSLKETNDQQQAMLNFQSAQYNDMYDRGIKRENEVISLKRQIAELEVKPAHEKDYSNRHFQLVKPNDGWPYCGLSLK